MRPASVAALRGIDPVTASVYRDVLHQERVALFTRSLAKGKPCPSVFSNLKGPFAIRIVPLWQGPGGNSVDPRSRIL